MDRALRGSDNAGRVEASWEGPGAALRTALGHLSDPDRQVIILRYLLDLPVEETSSVLGVPAGTVKSRSSRALARLRQVISQGDPALRQALQE